MPNLRADLLAELAEVFRRGGDRKDAAAMIADAINLDTRVASAARAYSQLALGWAAAARGN